MLEAASICVGFLEFDQGLRQVALGADLQPRGDVRLPGLEAGAVGAELIIGIGRILAERLLVELERGVKVLASLFGAALGDQFVPLFGSGVERQCRSRPRPESVRITANFLHMQHLTWISENGRGMVT